MRLLMVTGDRQVAFGERGPLYAMQAEFSRHFERVDVLCPRPPGPVRVTTIHGNVHLHPASVPRAAMAPWIVRRGAELVREHGHALVTSHDYGLFYNGFGSAGLSEAAGVPYVSEIHHVPGVPVAATRSEALERAAARAYVGWAKDRAAAFRVVNHGEMPDLLARWGVPAERVAVLPSLYIDLEVFRPPERPLEPAQDVVFVGRLVENKGLERIVDALALLRGASGRAPTALFVGKGPRAAALRERVAALGLEASVRTLDWVDGPGDLAEIYRRSRVVVCASTCEGGPRFTVEAMACGTPAVSTPVGMMHELLRDGENGWLAGFDAESLADALGRALGDEDARRAAGERAREAAAAFEARASIRRYAEGLRRLAGDGA